MEISWEYSWKEGGRRNEQESQAPLNCSLSKSTKKVFVKWKFSTRETTSWAGLFLWQCFARPLQIEQNLAHFNQFQNTLGSGQGCISCGILVSGIRAREVSSEHMENMEMFSCSTCLSHLFQIVCNLCPGWLICLMR